MPATNARPVSCTLIPARLRTAYPVVRCMMQHADGATAAERAPYPEDRALEVTFAEAAEGRSSDGYLVLAGPDNDRVGYVERSGGSWFFRPTRDLRPVVRAAGIECDGAYKADTIVLADDTPGRVLLGGGWGWGCSTRAGALACAGFVIG